MPLTLNVRDENFPRYHSTWLAIHFHYLLVILRSALGLVGLSGFHPPRLAKKLPRLLFFYHRIVNKKHPRKTEMSVKRVTRIELATSAWEAGILPLNYTRINKNNYSIDSC